jgi:hypothetical protein
LLKAADNPFPLPFIRPQSLEHYYLPKLPIIIFIFITMPRKPRMKRNRNPEVGMKNRQLGLSKMANTWHQYYGGQVLVLIRKQDGGLAGFQSDPGLARNLSLHELHKVPLLGPHHFLDETNKAQPVLNVSPTQGSASLDDSSRGTDSNQPIITGLKFPSAIASRQSLHTQVRVKSPEILQPKPISGRQLRQKQALVTLLENSFK